MKTKLRLRQNFLALVLATCLSAPTWASGNPDLVGILASITDPANAAELGLSEDQLAKLNALIQQHESKALDFARQLRELPANERRLKQMESVRNIEKQGYALLTEPQQVSAEKWRLQKLGPMALLDSETATKFGLTAEQSAALNNVLEGRAALIRSLGSSEKAEDEIRKRFLEVLTQEQRSQWDTTVGVSKAPAVPVEGTPDLSETTGGASASTGSPSADGKMRTAMPTVPGSGLLLNFNAAPWAEVLKFVAKEADLNLQADSYPPGTFTYYAPNRRYSVSQAIDIMNGALLDKGFTLIQKNGVLKSVDLSAGESPEQIRGLIREFAELVDPKELDLRGEYEFLKCVFSLERTSVEDIEKEVKLMISPQGSVVSLPTSGQILITDLGGKLRLIQSTIERSENPDGVRSNKVVRLSLKHISADEVLAVARPLLGLKELANTSEDISVSMDAFGNTLFATGTPDKMQKLRDIVKELDVKPEDTGASVTASEQPVVRSHQLLGSDPTTTMDVLQSSFAGQPNINMAMDPKTNNIIVKATPTDHEFIDKLIAELAGQSSQFEIISLGTIDTQAALLTLEKFYGKPAKSTDVANAKGPIFYADPSARRLMVKGTQQEVDQIKVLIGKIEDSAPKMDSLGEGVRVLPVRGKAAERLLQQIEILRKASKSRINIKMPPDSKTPSTSQDKEQPVEPTKPTTQVAPRTLERLTSFLQVPGDGPIGDPPDQVGAPPSGEGEIVVMEGPSGLVFASDDPKALSQLDQLVRAAQEQMATSPSEPTIRFLKHIPASAAAELIRSVIAGEQATAGGGGLLGDVASSVLGGGGLFGGMFGGGGGGGSSSSNTISGAAVSGDVVITPDPRLNALWIQASPLDSLFIEDLILAMDIEGSDVTQTRGTPRIIYVENSEVADVETVVKQVFAPLIAQQAGAGGGNAQRPPSPEDFINLLRGGAGGNRRGGGGGGQSELKEQTMTVSSDKKNNALIVVAPAHLFKQVEQLVLEMDKAAAEDEQTIRTLPLDGTVNPTVVQNALTSVFGSSVKATSTSNPTTAPAANTGGNAQPFNFQQFQNRGRGTGGNPFGGGGFNPFGGGGGGGQFRQGGGGGGNPFGGGGNQGGGNRGGGNNNRGGGGGGGNRGGNRN